MKPELSTVHVSGLIMKNTSVMLVSLVAQSFGPMRTILSYSHIYPSE